VNIQLLAHAAGIAALGLSIRSSSHHCDRALRRHSFLAGVCWALNYFLLGAAVGGALSCVSAARSGTATLVEDRDLRSRALACSIFVLASIGIAILTWTDWTTLLPVAASILTTIAVFFLRGAWLRVALLVSALLWTQIVFQVHSPEQMIGNFLGIVAASVGLWRVRRRASAQALSTATPFVSIN
jgi:hypothetical protein